MEDALAKKWRLQYSLGTMLLLVITLGACLGFFLSYRENSKLRAENQSYRDELGILEIEDSRKAYVREIKTGDRDRWRRRMYIPHAGKFMVGFKTENVSNSIINRANAEYEELQLYAGQYLIDIQVVRHDLEFRVDRVDKHEIAVAYPGPATKHIASFSKFLSHWQRQGIDSSSVYSEIGQFSLPPKSSAFELDKPRVLVALKALTAAEDSDHSTLISNDRDLGLILWFEEAPK